MKRFVTGLDADGRSSIVSADDIDALNVPVPDAEELGFSVSALWATQNPVELEHMVRPDHADPTYIEMNLPSAATNVNLYRFKPNFLAPFHRTNTIDIDVVVEGQMDILMEDGSEGRLQVGDSVVVAGVPHGWRAGTEGCTLVTFLVGLPDQRK